MKNDTLYNDRIKEAIETFNISTNAYQDKFRGMNLPPNMIELIKQNNPEADFAVMDCRDIYIIDIKFDGILCVFCLPYQSKEESLKFISEYRYS